MSKSFSCSFRKPRYKIFPLYLFFCPKEISVQPAIDKAILLNLGARGLRSICEAILTDSMFNAPDKDIKELIIDLSYAEKQFSESKVSKLKVA